MTLSEELQWRGFVNQTTYPDINYLDGDPIKFYWGVDPSADSMTIGHLFVAMMVRHLMKHGHKAYILVGGATGMIGDPDGKASERNLMSFEQIEANKAAIIAQYRTVFADRDFEVVDNYDWFKNLSYLDFLRQVGKHVPLSNMLGRDFIQARLGESGSGISYAEFSYSLIQGYDFLHLFRNHGVTLQVCGADQWGNSIAGIDLIRRSDGGEAHIFSTPLLINKATGKKFGKTEAGAVWLDPKKTSVYQFYQFWLNVDDEGVEDYLKAFTMFSREDIEHLSERQKANPSARPAQKELAFEVTKLVHGQERAESALRVTDVLFGGVSVSELGHDELVLLGDEILTADIVETAEQRDGSTKTLLVSEALVQTGEATSLGNARRLIEGGGVSVNGQKLQSDVLLKDLSLIKKGKNSFILVRP